MATTAFFWFPVAWSIIFYPFVLNLCLFLELRWFSWRQHIVGSCFLIHTATLSLLVVEFNPFIFRMCIDKWGLSTAILSFVVWLFYISIISFSLCFCLPFGWWFSMIFFLCFFFFYVLHLYSRFMLCGYHEVCIKHLIGKVVLFLW